MLLSKAYRLQPSLRSISRPRLPIRMAPQSQAQLRFIARPAKQLLTAKPTKIKHQISDVSRNKSPKKGIYWSLLGVSVVAGVFYATKDDETSLLAKVDKLATTFGRIGVVTIATVKCFYLYKVLLDKKFDSPEEEKKAFSETHLKAALITRKALETNAGIFIKLGQHIAALTYLFPPEWTETMIPLQDCCPVSSIEIIDQMVKTDMGSSIEELFTEFDPVPLGTASLAQVHRAHLRSTGEEVAVKFQHPSLKEFVPLDVLMTRTVFAIMDYVFPDYPMVWLSDELQESIYVELDFTNEARNARRTSDYFKNHYDVTALRIPEVYSAYPRILVMEFLGGCRPDDVEFLDKHNISRADISSAFAHIFNDMIFTPNVGLHCDPHAGNIAIRPLKNSYRNFEIILYDHGLYRDVPTDVCRKYAHFWLALIDKNEPDMRKYAKEFAGISDDQFKLFAAAITGRDFENSMNNVVSRRSYKEIENMTKSFSQDGFLSQIIIMLHSMPRIVLLILKTNDLTRYLDEKLDSPLGVERTFLIMASYCAKTVYDEGRESIMNKYNRWSLRRWSCLFFNWWQYFKRQQQMNVYDSLMCLKNLL